MSYRRASRLGRWRSRPGARLAVSRSRIERGKNHAKRNSDRRISGVSIYLDWSRIFIFLVSSVPSVANSFHILEAEEI